MAAAVAVLAAALLLAGCSPQRLVLHGVADQLAAQGQSEEDDLVLARDAAPFYLKLSESVLRQAPDHVALAEAVSGGLTQYAYAFVAFEADRLEGTDVRAAQRLRQRAARLYERAHRHAMAALESRDPALVRTLGQSGALPRVRVEHVGLAYWAAASWGAAIALSKDRPEAVADLPRAVRLAQAAYASAPGHRNGALATLVAQFELARPGGSVQEAARLLEQAAAAGDRAGALLARAESIALPSGDRAAFERELLQAVQAASGRTLERQVQRERAQWLLDTIDDRF